MTVPRLRPENFHRSCGKAVHNRHVRVLNSTAANTFEQFAQHGSDSQPILILKCERYQGFGEARALRRKNVQREPQSQVNVVLLSLSDFCVTRRSMCASVQTENSFQ
jgi:hypothetical protein